LHNLPTRWVRSTCEPSDTLGTQYLRVLLLPEIPRLRPVKLLVTASGALAKRRSRQVLVIEGENIVVREVTSTQIDEQTTSVDILSIEPEPNPDE